MFKSYMLFGRRQSSLLLRGEYHSDSRSVLPQNLLSLKRMRYLPFVHDLEDGGIMSPKTMTMSQSQDHRRNYGRHGTWRRTEASCKTCACFYSLRLATSALIDITAGWLPSLVHLHRGTCRLCISKTMRSRTSMSVEPRRPLNRMPAVWESS